MSRELKELGEMVRTAAKKAIEIISESDLMPMVEAKLAEMEAAENQTDESDYKTKLKEMVDEALEKEYRRGYYDCRMQSELISCEYCDSNHWDGKGTAKTNFCPMCGRKLGRTDLPFKKKEKTTVRLYGQGGHVVEEWEEIPQPVSFMEAVEATRNGNWDRKQTKATKKHACDICKKTINPGEGYMREKGLSGGDWNNYALCFRCNYLLQKHTNGEELWPLWVLLEENDLLNSICPTCKGRFVDLSLSKNKQIVNFVCYCGHQWEQDISLEALKQEEQNNEK